MANFTEITPVVRRVLCDRRGRAQLVFTLSNVLSRRVELTVRVLAAAPLNADWFMPQAAGTLSLAPRASAQWVIEAALPPMLPRGEYEVRVEVAEANGSGTRWDTSPIVLLQVPQAMVGAQPEVSGPETAADAAGAEPAHRWFRSGFGAILGVLGAVLRRLFRPLLNWFWGGKPGEARVVDIQIVKKALIVIAVIYVMSLGPKLLSVGKPIAFPNLNSACTTPLTDEAIAKRLEHCAQEKNPVQCAEEIPCFQEQSSQLLDSSRFVRFLKTFRPEPRAAPRAKSRASLCELFRSGAHNESTSIPPGSTGLPVPPRIRIQP